VNISTTVYNRDEDIKKSAVIKILLEEVKLRCLKYGLHASESPLIVSVNLHHFHEVLVSVQTVDILGDKRHQVAQNR
jgi:hypothetical protein